MNTSVFASHLEITAIQLQVKVVKMHWDQSRTSERMHQKLFTKKVHQKLEISA